MQCLNSELIDQVWVTSDDDEILQTSIAYGANPIKRPQQISSDNSSSEEAWIHAIDFISKRNIVFDVVLGIQATSPLRNSQDFDNAIKKFQETNADSLLSVVELEDFFVWEKTKDTIKAINYDYKNRKIRQNIEKKFLENGSFYIFRKKFFEESFCRLGGKISYYKMEKYKMFQIDNFDDIVLCETIMKSYGLDKS